MSAEEDLSLEAKAREWLDMAQTKWRLQTMQHRSRFNPKTGEYKQLPTRVRRFLNGTPVSMKARVLAILKETAPYSCPVFDLETGDMKYIPTNTFIRKDGPELSSGSDATYTIVQDLKLLDEAGDTFGMRDESSCAQIGESEWHWDEPDVIDCPDGSQGVSYQVASVSRDRETDLFSYVVRKVQALTVHTPPVVAACTERNRVTVETWDNVYGEPGAFRYDPVRGGAHSLNIPEACDRSDGTLVRVSVNRNADCTYRVEVERTEAVTGVVMYYSQHDQYKSESSERTLNSFSPLSKQGIEYDHGIVTRYQSERNDDGTWTNDVSKSIERTVTKSTVEERRTPRSTTRTRVDTNVPSPASGVSTEFGSWKSTKTPGGLFTNEYVEHIRRIVDDLGLVCTDTAFLKTHETQGSADAVPSSAHVPPAHGGLVTTWSYDTDAEGIVTKRIRTEQEHTVENAVRRRTWGWLGTTSGYVHKSVSSSVASALLASGDAGTSVEARMTNGGLFDVEVQTFLRIAGLRLGFDCQKTVYQHVHETAESASEMGADASDARNGRTYRKSYTLDTTTGAITKRESVTTELEVPESRRTVRVTSRGKTVRTVKSNSPSKVADASSPGQTTEFEVTPGGRFNVTIEETIPNDGDIEYGCQKDAFEEADSSSNTSKTKGPSHVAGGKGGVYREKVSRLGDDGLWENRTIAHKETPNVDNGVEVVVTARGRRRTVKTKNATRPAEPTEIGKSLRTSRTRGGLYDVESTETIANPNSLGKDCSRDAFEHADGTTKVSKSRPSPHVTGGSGGKYMERTSRQGDDGLWETHDVEHVEMPSVDDGVEIVVTARGKRKTTKTRSAPKPPEPSADKVGSSLRTSRTRGGRYNVESTVVTANPNDIGVDCSRDAFEHADGTTNVSKTKPNQHVTGGSGGKYMERTSRQGDDGLWETREVEHVETKDVDDGVDIVVTARGMRKTTKTRNASNKPAEPSVTDVGESLRTSRTKGGLYNTETTEITANPSDLGKDCSRDAFEHTHGRINTSKSKPKDEHIVGGKDGEYRERTSRLGDDGLWETHEVEHFETKDVEDGVDIVVTARGMRKTTKTRNASNKPAEPSVTEVGKSIRTSRTKGGLYNTETTEFTANPDNIGIDCSKDLFSHIHTEVHTSKEKEDDELKDTTDGSGEYIDKRQRRGDDGLWEITEATHTENPVEEQRTEVRVTKAGRIKRTTDVQINSTEKDPEANIDNIGKERIVEKTRGGKRNITTVEVTKVAGNIQESCSQDAFLHTHVTTKGVDSNSLNGRDVPEAKDGEYIEKDLVVNELGIWEERETTHRELQRESETVNYQDAFGTRVVRLYANDKDRFDEKNFNAEDLIKSVEQEMTRGRKYSARVTEEKPTEVDSGWLHFDKVTDKGLAVYYDFIVFRNAKMKEVKSWIAHIEKIKYSGGIGSYANHPSISISPNRFRLWDGAIAITTTFTPKTWASGGNTTDDNWNTDDIKIRSVNFVPLSQSKLLKIVTTEYHNRGGGVGYDRMRAVLAGGDMIKGSQFSYHPSGQAYSYDIITKVITTAKVIDMPQNAAQIWDGTGKL